MPDAKRKLICEALESLIGRADELLAPLGPEIWHGQTMLYDAESTKRVSGFLQECHAVVDCIGGKALKWKSVFASPDMDVNLMRQIAGILQGLKSSVEKGLLDIDGGGPDSGGTNGATETKMKQFDALVREGRELLQGHDAARTGIAHHRWCDSVGDFLQYVAPGTALSAQWASTGTSPLLSGGHYHDHPVVWLNHRKLLAEQLKWLGVNVPHLLQKLHAPESLWGLLHAEIVEIAKPRFDAKHFADAVEAALKHVNEAVKKIVRDDIAKELDGAALMNVAFSPNDPVIEVGDMTTETGKSMQLGYMQIFAGAMTGIRNPKAHANLTISAETAIHHLFIASLLMYRVEGGRRTKRGYHDK